MKTETINIVPREEVNKAIEAVVADKGTMGAAGKEIGVTHSMLYYVLRGYSKPGRKILDFFGLEAHTVFVRKTKPQGK